MFSETGLLPKPDFAVSPGLTAVAGDLSLFLTPMLDRLQPPIAPTPGDPKPPSGCLRYLHTHEVRTYLCPPTSTQTHYKRHPDRNIHHRYVVVADAATSKGIRGLEPTTIRF